MSRKRFKPEVIVNKLREADVLIAQGRTVAHASKQIGVTEQTYYRWRKEYSGRGWVGLRHRRGVQAPSVNRR